MPDNILAEVPYDLLEDFNPDKQKKDKLQTSKYHLFNNLIFYLFSDVNLIKVREQYN